MSNAFASGDWLSMGAATQELPTQDAWGLGEQRCRSCVFSVPRRDQQDPLLMRPGRGGIIGD
eukprot:1356378-Pyramimonas_sp.AAC.1